MVLMAEHTTRLAGHAIVTSRLWSECPDYWFALLFLCLGLNAVGGRARRALRG